jgi:hypothetical protein
VLFGAYHSSLPGCKSIFGKETPHDLLLLAFDPQGSDPEMVFLMRAEDTGNSSWYLRVVDVSAAPAHHL